MKTYVWFNPEPVEDYEKQENAVVVVAENVNHARATLLLAVERAARRAYPEYAARRRKYFGVESRAAYVMRLSDALRTAPWFRKRPRILPRHRRILTVNCGLLDLVR